MPKKPYPLAFRSILVGSINHPFIQVKSAMPLYQYQCKACGERFEAALPVEAEHGPICPSCQSQETQKKPACTPDSAQKAGDYASKFASSSFASRRRFT